MSGAKPSQAAPDRQDAPQWLAELYPRIARELELARQTAMQVEQSLCRAADSWSIDDARVRDLQQLDHLIQHLAAMRDFVFALCQQGQGVRVDAADALARVTLSDVRSRLSGCGESENVSASGGVEMF